MFCEKCGNSINENQRFCSKCGAPIVHTGDEGISSNEKDSKWEMPKVDTAKLEEGVSGIKNKINDYIKNITGLEFWKKMNRTSVIVISVIAITLILLFANGAAINNFVHKTFGSPKSYYQFVEKKSAKEIASFSGELYDAWLNTLNIHDKSINGELSVELGEDGQEIIELAGLAGLDLSWIQSVNLSLNSSVKNNVSQIGMSADINKDQILSGNLIMDMKNESIYFQIPELTKTYLGVELNEVLSDYDQTVVDEILEMQASNKKQLEKLPGEAKIEKLVNKYLFIALDCVDDVTKKKKTIKAEGIQQKCTELTITIDSDTMNDIAEAVLSEIEDDKELEKIITDVVEASDSDLDADEIYDSFIDEVESILNNLQYYADYDLGFVMKVYVDGKGKIKGRSFELEDNSNEAISFMMPEKGKKFGYEMSADVDGVSVKIVGSGKHSGDIINGDFEVKINGASILEIKAKKLNIEELKLGRLNGKFEANCSSKIANLADLAYTGYSLSAIEDLKVTLESNTTDNSCKYKLGVIYDDQNIGDVAISLVTKDGNKASVPSARNTVMVEDPDDLEEWVENIVWDKVIAKLEKTDLPRELIKLVESIGEAADDGNWDKLSRLLMIY